MYRPKINYIKIHYINNIIRSNCEVQSKSIVFPFSSPLMCELHSLPAICFWDLCARGGDRYPSYLDTTWFWRLIQCCLRAFLISLLCLLPVQRIALPISPTPAGPHTGPSAVCVNSGDSDGSGVQDSK